MSRKKVLLVDDQESVRRLVGATLGGAGLDLEYACDGEEALDKVYSFQPDLILLDIMMPKKDGYEVCRTLKEDPATAGIHIIIITARGSDADVVLGHKVGADDYFVKPFSPLALMSKVESALAAAESREPASTSPGASSTSDTLLVPPVDDDAPSTSADVSLAQRVQDLETSQKQLLMYAEELSRAFYELQATYFSTLEALSSAIDARDHYTFGHSRLVRNYALMIGKEMGLPAQKLETLQQAALLHDIGKIGLPDAIIMKPGTLTTDELDVVRRHPQLGYEILSGLSFLEEALDGIRFHQERYDGKGYPVGLVGDQVPLMARILAVADSYEAMTSDRPYRQQLSRTEAIAELMRGTGIQFDPEVVRAFLKALANDQ